MASGQAAQAASPEGGLDGRGWELVSPVEKNGGGIEAPGSPGGGAFQAALAGGGFGYGSPASFSEAEGAPPVSQYRALRADGGWTSTNLSPPMLSGTYVGGAYQLLSADLTRGILTNGWACREGGEACEAENPPFGSGAPAGYRNLYLREGATYAPLVSSANSPALSVPAADFRLALAGATADLDHIVISTCAKLTAAATEVPAGSGCDAAATNLYEWSAGTLTPVNFLPAQGVTATGAALAAPSGAISSDGSRVYFTQGGNLYLRDASATLQVDQGQGGGGAFQVASADGSLALFVKAGHLYRYSLSTESATDLTPAGGVQGVLGGSQDGTYVYYVGASGLFAWHSGSATKIAASADVSNYPPALGTARLSADGTRLAFLSSASLTGFANAGKTEVYLYEIPASRLTCVSCNSTKTTPLGPASIPGASPAGGGPAAYRPRALTAEGTRVFFTSADKLLSVDSDKAPDVYEWEAQGTGGCATAGGCVGLISSGRVSSASFLDASADGSDAFFLTAASLLPADIGGADVYDARAAGGFPEPPQPVPCEGDECQGPPQAPDDPVPGTAVFEGPANPPVHYPRVKKRHHKKRHRHRHHAGGRRR